MPSVSSAVSPGSDQTQPVAGDLARPAVSPRDARPAGAYFLEAVPETLSLSFRGCAREYFRIWIVNLCLTVFTLGIFSAWAKVRKKRYFYASTILDGTPFRYLARPVPILKGRLVAVALSGLFWFTTKFMDAWMPALIAVTAILAPWIVSRSVAFNARYSEFRGMAFQFDAGYLATARELYWGLLLPGVLTGTLFQWWQQPALGAAAIALFGMLLPVWLARMKRFTAGHLLFGGQRANCAIQGRELWGIYMGGGLLMVPASIVMVFAGIVAVQFLGMPTEGVVIAGPVGAGIAYLGVFAFIRARSQNAVWNGTRLGPLRFKLSLQAREMAKLYLTNTLAILATLGLATPWAAIRTFRYRIERTQIEAVGDLDEFRRPVSAENVRAAGAETSEMFDLDLSL